MHLHEQDVVQAKYKFKNLEIVNIIGDSVKNRTQ